MNFRVWIPLGDIQALISLFPSQNAEENRGVELSLLVISCEASACQSVCLSATIVHHHNGMSGFVGSTLWVSGSYIEPSGSAAFVCMHETFALSIRARGQFVLNFMSNYWENLDDGIKVKRNVIRLKPHFIFVCNQANKQDLANVDVDRLYI